MLALLSIIASAWVCYAPCVVSVGFARPKPEGKPVQLADVPVVVRTDDLPIAARGTAEWSAAALVEIDGLEDGSARSWKWYRQAREWGLVLKTHRWRGPFESHPWHRKELEHLD